MRILFLTHRLPYAPNRGDRVRAYHLIHEMSRWAEVDLVSLIHDVDEASHISDLRQVTTSITTGKVPRLLNAMRAAVALPTARPTTHSMLHAPGLAAAIARLVENRKPDVIFAFCTGIAPYALAPALTGVPLVLDMVDVDSAKWAALSTSTAPPMSWVYRREASRLASFEREICRRARSTWVVTDKEKDTLAALAPGVPIEIVPNGVDVDALKRPAGDEAAQPTVVFCGVMNYAPNVEGVIWLARNVWPEIRKRVPGARFQIVGSSPSSRVRELADDGAGIEVTGNVPDVRPFLWSASASVAPLLTARGIQNKVLEAVAAGLPAVVTPVVYEPLPAAVKCAVTPAGDPEAFANAVVGLLQLSQTDRRSIAGGADLGSLTWPTRLGRAKNLVAQAILRPENP